MSGDVIERGLQWFREAYCPVCDVQGRNHARVVEESAAELRPLLRDWYPNSIAAALPDVCLPDRAREEAIETPARCLWIGAVFAAGRFYPIITGPIGFCIGSMRLFFWRFAESWEDQDLHERHAGVLSRFALTGACRPTSYPIAEFQAGRAGQPDFWAFQAVFIAPSPAVLHNAETRVAVFTPLVAEEGPYEPVHAHALWMHDLRRRRVRDLMWVCVRTEAMRRQWVGGRWGESPLSPLAYLQQGPSEFERPAERGRFDPTAYPGAEWAEAIVKRGAVDVLPVTEDGYWPLVDSPPDAWPEEERSCWNRWQELVQHQLALLSSAERRSRRSMRNRSIRAAAKTEE